MDKIHKQDSPPSPGLWHKSCSWVKNKVWLCTIAMSGKQMPLLLLELLRIRFAGSYIIFYYVIQYLGKIKIALKWIKNHTMWSIPFDAKGSTFKHACNFLL